ncbi:DsbA family protein [Actinomyces minihominis]|uniref:DsbA family protein n=1 Tax=Actinomyces minihominis TaxID=2002838 RepID=UPI001A9258A6|nr:DsbA family protein [Actinomyces minihominis]
MENQPKKSSATRIVVPILIVIIAILLLVVAWLVQGSSLGKEPLGAQTSGTAVTEEVEGATDEVGDANAGAEAPAENDLTTLEAREENDPLAVGAVDAPVAMIVYSDYQCPYCGRFNEETLPVMMEYVDQGLLRIEWRDANFFGPASETAARAAYAAGLQGRFLEFNNALFPGGDKLADTGLTEEALTALAGELGLDQAQFEADLTDPATATIIAEHAALVQGIGVTSTPTVILGGVPVIGAQPTDVFVQTFEDVLAKTQQG